MTSKHTGGDWGVATIDCGAADDEVVTLVNGCMVNIAAVFGAGEYSEARPDGKDEPHYEVSKEEAEANARLIAAAPDLLEALELTLNAVCLAGWYDDYSAVKAREAIAKAKGE